ncbi:MAG: exodeoxyribonuclease V subunit alpha [Glaciecola sp.]|nr:exodeoxyribonuclease V subunit alpha [Glaciecola sp.]MDG1469718.1 exodeoxyribonuclease V subunit alpha [Glaciecola sp.]
MSIQQFTQTLNANSLDIALVKTQLTAYFENSALAAEMLASEIQTACALLLALQQAQCQGHSHLKLTDLAKQCYFADMNEVEPAELNRVGYTFPELGQINQVIQLMQQHPIHGALLVLHENCLFSQKIFEYEQYISYHVSQRIQTLTGCITPQALQLFTQLYPNPETNPWQPIASLTALTQPFYIINGGPGTGKTYTVLRTLLLILAQHQGTLSIGLCAPTGKAAQRVSESIINEVAALKKQSVALELLEHIPEQATTIHRLLAIRKGSGEARYNSQHPLPYDLLVIDEASMLDTALFYRLLNACRPDTRIILIGDTAQLPSVESGAVLHDLMPKCVNVFSDSICTWLDTFSPNLSQHISKSIPQDGTLRPETYTNYATTLLQNMRSNARVNEVANAIYSSDTPTMTTKLADVQTLWSQAAPDITPLSQGLLLNNKNSGDNLHEQLKIETTRCLLALTTAYYEPLLTCSDPVVAIELLKQFRILTPMRKGLYGVSGINNLIDQSLLKKINDPLKISINGMYHGRAILITQNDAQLGVFNGDSGVVLLNDENVLTAYIDRGKQPPLAISPYRLPEVQSLYAMTIHKTQGSEFDKVFIILPPDESAGITKELIYTGITRARSYVAVSGTTEALTRAIAKHHQRNTFIRILDDAGK